MKTVVSLANQALTQDFSQAGQDFALSENFFLAPPLAVFAPSWNCCVQKVNINTIKIHQKDYIFGCYELYSV